jgi:ribonuclease HI
MAKKFYGVKVGRLPGVYSSWDECKSQVDQFPGAIYKGFGTEDAAWEFVDGIEDGGDISYDGVVAYVDGSYENESQVYAYGVVILNGERETHLSDRGYDKEMALMHNVAGDIMGAMAAMQYAQDNGLDSILIIHDYAGIAEWAKGTWKANKKGTKAYKEFYDEVSETVDVQFKKVEGHSGDFYNDLADALAKKELGMRIKKTFADRIEDIENEE